MEIHGSDSNSGRSCHHKFNGILCCGDSAHTDHGNGNRLGRLPYHTDRDRFDRRTGKTAGLVGQYELSLFNIDLCSRNRIDQRDRVCTACLCRAGHLRDIGHIGCELHDHRLRRLFFDPAGDVIQRVRILAEGDGALLDIGTRDIDLEHVHCLLLQAPDNVQIVLYALAADIDDHFRVHAFQKSQIAFDEDLHARILQADGIEHTGTDLCHARRGITRPRDIGNTFGNDTAQPAKVDEFRILKPGPKGSRSREHRIFEGHARNGHGHVRFL